MNPDDGQEQVGTMTGQLSDFLGTMLMDLVRGLVMLSFVKLVLNPRHSSSSKGSSWTATSRQVLELTGPFLLLTIARLWLAAITVFVPEPYLDEVFHIPQAQKYCQGCYYDWDGKITTPPGLYAATILFNRAQGIVSCTPESLRRFNVYAIALVGLMVQDCRHLIEERYAAGCNRNRHLSFYAIHAALNVGLFPLLFFFSGLYYTDVMSSLAVLVAYRVHLARTASATCPSFLSGIMVVLVGMISLTIRQTNVFWVVVFMGGLEMVHAVKTLELEEPGSLRSEAKAVDRQFWSYFDLYRRGDVHDPPVNLTWPDDRVISFISLGTSAVFNPTRVLRMIWPYLAVLFSFGGFVAWNRGVVLGDKSNHVATFHLAQMLYLWPLFLFFSVPLCLPFGFHYALRVVMFAEKMRRQPRQRQPELQNEVDRQATPRSKKIDDQAHSRKRGAARRYLGPKVQLPGTGTVLLDSVMRQKGYMITLSGFIILCMAGVVKFNTIIHPFTLADNRHYMFYMFRYTVRRNWWTRYALLFPYWTSMISVRRCFAGCQPVHETHGNNCPVRHQTRLKYLNSPFMDASLRERKLQKRVERTLGPQEREVLPPGSAKTELGLEHVEQESASDIFLSGTCPPETMAPAASTESIWFLASALSLITAPLVEPRYFILPWIFWRLHVPAWQLHDCAGDSCLIRACKRVMGASADGGPAAVVELGQKLDIRLLAETAWFVAINLATMYMFIGRPFYWYDEAGNVVDGGKLQRFMW